MEGNCANCGGCKHAEICDHCGHCRNCGRLINNLGFISTPPNPTTVTWPNPNIPPFPLPLIVPTDPIKEPYIGDPIPPNFTISSGTGVSGYPGEARG